MTVITVYVLYNWSTSRGKFPDAGGWPVSRFLPV